ncbi:MAG: hemerythrin domain-containing protein [Ignavibacteriaceae bacterium]|nr:hemerythrin domain-containing protein [Ignavibacteriaceae bacterium]HMN24022.1 hemerythrin domain-containing protein [Ignavibacteriaceae bacterium]HRN26402.1 hemerythrin domain-containing protein [Ignavibacteriaceae bacterium]HRP93770.1 hemerythrin domain-containing protein [Ignavibacteriaceae bacterium]HRQ54035.1 hemerythrin domain-containing protein [Ignavibacteriaceae bacterium]
MENKTKSSDDPIKRFAEKDTAGEELSPFDPPDAYDPQNIKPVPYEEMHPFLKKLIDEHEAFTKVLNTFESALMTWRNDNWVFNATIDSGFKQFFSFMDEKVPLHNQKEEKNLFPILQIKLIESGEHNTKDPSFTGISLMEDEHIKVAQAAAIVFNFLGLGSRLPDKRSQQITFEAAYQQGMAIIETMKLHIFREENILFPQTMKLFNSKEFEKLD